MSGGAKDHPQRALIEELARGTDEKAARARLALTVGLAFQDAVHAELARRELPLQDAFGAAISTIVDMMGFLTDHLVVRGFSEAAASHAVAGTVARCFSNLRERKAAAGYVPMPNPDPERPFDFRAMMKGEG